MNDDNFKRKAVDLARQAIGEDDRAHPKVGAVVALDGKELTCAFRGEMRPGEHAEFTALERKIEDGSIVGATVFTTLEPCTTRNHPKVPCAQRLIERKVARVVIGMLDPNRDIHGSGVRRLRAAGIDVQFFGEPFASEIEDLNRNFIRAQEHATSSSEVRPDGGSVHIPGDLRAGDGRNKRGGAGGEAKKA